MILLANTILAGHWPYYITMYMWPLVLLVETVVLKRRHRSEFHLLKAFAIVLIMNVVSFFVGGIANKGGIRGLELASNTVTVVSSIMWAWAMSTVIEHLVLRLWLKDIPWQQCAKTSAMMNLASYGLIIAPALVWIATR